MKRFFLLAVTIFVVCISFSAEAQYDMAESAGDEPLLVMLSSFTAISEGGKITLRWSTEAEINNAGFALYRSDTKDGNYTKIAFVPGAEDSETENDYQVMDKGVEGGKTYFYFLEDIDLTGDKSKSRIIKVVVPPAQTGLQLDKPALPIPKVFRLLQNYPNPFNPETWIPYQLAKNAEVTIKIYNAFGQLIKTISSGEKEAGFYTNKDEAAYWDGMTGTGEPVASGVYFYNIKAGEFYATRRMVIIK